MATKKASLRQVMLEAGADIAAFSGVLVRVPCMKNGRCFPSSMGLACAPKDLIAAQVSATRNDMGDPCLPDGRLDHARHEAELAGFRGAWAPSNS